MRDTSSMCESSRYRQEKRQMTAFSLGARLYLGANSTLALSLPQSRLCILWARQLCPLAVLRLCFGYSLSHLRTAAACRLTASATGGARKPNPSEGAEAAPPQTTDLQRCAPQLSPPLAGCPHPSRCGAAPHRATFPKGKAKRSAAAVRTDLILCTAPHSTLHTIPHS